jgi:hypothetical protein
VVGGEATKGHADLHKFVATIDGAPDSLRGSEIDPDETNQYRKDRNYHQ